MKPQMKQFVTRVSLFAILLLAICSFARPANAQAEFQGRFTLPYAAHWGKAVLPAGDFLLTFTRFEGTAMLLVQDAKSGRYVANEPVNITEESTKSGSALLIGTRAGQRIVQSLRIAELGRVFVYEPELASGHTVEEANRTQVVPISTAKK
jgi:hypothetical protein